MNPYTWYALDGATTVIACVITLFYCFPAYKRTKQPGFLVWCFSALGSLWNSVTLHTIGSDPHNNPAGYLFIHQSYRVLFIVDAVFGIIGTVLIVNSYLRLFEIQPRETSGFGSGENHHLL